MKLYLWWILSLIIGNILLGVVKSVLGVEIISSVEHGVLIYNTIDTMVTCAIFYLSLLAVLGHWAK